MRSASRSTSTRSRLTNRYSSPSGSWQDFQKLGWHRGAGAPVEVTIDGDPLVCGPSDLVVDLVTHEADAALAQ